MDVAGETGKNAGVAAIVAIHAILILPLTMLRIRCQYHFVHFITKALGLISENAIVVIGAQERFNTRPRNGPFVGYTHDERHLLATS